MNDQPIGTPEVASDLSHPASLPYRPLRAWPAVILLVLMVAARYGPELVGDSAANYWMISVFGPLLCCLLLLIWWLAASRATWRERVFGSLGLLGGAALVVVLSHPSMRGPGTTYLTLPMGFLLFGAGAVWFRRSAPRARTGAAVLLAIAGFSFTTLLRNEGMTGNYKFTWHPRWSHSPEEELLASPKADAAPPAINSESAKLTNALLNPEWPAFRGVNRDGRSPAPKIATNWAAHPPQQLWKIKVGPGWSSFAIAGQRLFTQEQRGGREAVLCYDADSGSEIWKTEFDSRLEDPMGGPGPRATPTLADGALYVTGSTGVFLRLDPVTGKVLWTKQLTEVAGRKVPMWGFASSPLVVGALVLVYAGGPDDKGLLAFDTASGELRWSVPGGSESYASPQLNTILGEDLVLMFSNDALTGVEPASGKVRLNYEWKFSNYRALQPAVVGSDTVLLTTGMNVGTRAIRLTKDGENLKSEELWTSKQLKPDFADLVTYEGYAYGNDGGLLVCLDLKTGERKWKDGRYGKGQILLLESSGLLLVAAEQGQVALVSANPGAYTEVASFAALEGKTWNHPVLVRDRLYVRNSQEAAAFRLPLAAPEP